MPLNDSRTTFAFPNLSEPSYKRLPGLLADALPDDFGNTLIDAWMSRKGVEKRNVTVLDRLSYMGRRGMGALEFKPARGAHRESAEPLEMKSLVEAARMAIQGDLSGKPTGPIHLDDGFGYWLPDCRDVQEGHPPQIRVQF
jgi:serine/threonine-protein kinase HipA